MQAMSHSHAGHGHDHAALAPDRIDRVMAIGVGLNTAFVGVEVAAGISSGSLALLSDAGHNAGDVVGLLLAWAAHALARLPPTRRFTRGLGRSTIFAAFTNAALLLAACGAILWEAVHRLAEPAVVQGPVMIAVAAVGVVINTLTAWLLARGRREDANLRGAFLHMAADAAVSAGVVVAGVVIGLSGWFWIDPAVSILISLVIAAGGWDLLRESTALAMDAVPRGVDVGRIASDLAGIEGVAGVHDLHVWGASTSAISASVHLEITDASRADPVLAEATRILQKTHAISHTTVQLNPSPPKKMGTGAN